MSDRKAAGYLSTFVDFVEKPADIHGKDESDDASQNSEDESAKQASRPAGTEKTNLARRGRLRGPKSVRCKTSKNNTEKGSDSTPPSDVEPDEAEAHVVKRVIRPARVSKAEAVKKTKRLVRKRKISDVDSDGSDAAEDLVDAVIDDEKESPVYDSDEDPGWKPSKPKRNSGSGGSAKKQKKRDSSSEKEDSSKSSRARSTSRGRGRGRGRGHANGVSSKPGSTSTTQTSQQPKELSDAVLPSGMLAPATVPPAAIRTEAVKLVSSYIPRPPGRPSIYSLTQASSASPTIVGRPTNAPVNLGPLNNGVPLAAVATTENYIADLNPPHSCQRGDFILDRRDSDNYTTFSIWRIDSQRLLQKFEAFEKDGKLLHRALCTYSSWPVHAQQNYTAIGVRYVSCTRGKEIVEVHEKYRPRPLGVKGAELSALQEAFTIYTQILLSQALEPTFIGALIEEPDEYYTEPMEKVEKVVKGRLEKVEKLGSWKIEFLTDLKKFHAFTLIDCPDGSSWSQATSNSTEQAKKSVKFHGHVYNHDTLQSTEQVAESNGPEYALTASESIVVTVLHGLHHLMYKLCLVCQTRIEELKESSPSIEDHEVLDTCLRDKPWMQQMFSRLSGLLENADRVAGL